MIMPDKNMDDFDSIKPISGKTIRSGEKIIGYKKKKSHFVIEKANKMKQYFYK